MIRLIPTEEDKAVIETVALGRHNEMKGVHDTYGYQGDQLQPHREGVLAEWACAKAYGLPWVTVLPRDLVNWYREDSPYGDVGYLEVRGRVRKSHGAHLLSHDRDDSRYAMTLVLLSEGLYSARIAGWHFVEELKVLGGHPKRGGEWDKMATGRPCYWTEIEDLLDPEELHNYREFLIPSSYDQRVESYVDYRYVQ